MKTLEISKKKPKTHSELVQTLTEFKFIHVPMVLEAGEFSVRGNIIDIFAHTHSNPIRIEYNDNTIERLSSFSLSTQRTLAKLEKSVIQEITQKPSFKPLTETHNTDLLFECKLDDLIVHEDYGIGIFKGCVRLKISQKEIEYLHIQYKGEDKVYVPLEQLKKCHKYTGPEDIEINGLYDGAWLRKTRKAHKEIESLAEEIYFMYKIRLSKPGFKYKEDTETQLLFEKKFPYTLTKDQERALEEIKKDMEKNIPMDRILCGDVGYGKTELILRATFKAIENGKQVAILCPTTLLCAQHSKLFKERIEPFYYTVEELSRFIQKKDKEKTIKNIEEGHVDVVVGTHAILSEKIKFKNLGLVIIDEEQRFGVKQKEHLKKTFPLIDILNVSATPIPRTLHLSMTGARDISLIKTPPPLKKEIYTLLSEENEEILKEAIEYEINRNGQLFYMINKIHKLNFKAQNIKKAFPTLNIAIAHAKQSERTLEKTVKDFIDKKIDVLVSTSIIENGLNIENANTIIIDEAHTLGLSQLHQMRGRVGRGSTQAYAYLFTKPEETLTDKARKRIQAIKEYASLGSGHNLALKDLEIRGAGSIFGSRQHGHIANIGFQLYCRLLESSVHKAKGEKQKEEHVLKLNPEKITLSENYISNSRERLALYTRFFTLENTIQLTELQAELEDRYGKFSSEEKEIFQYLENKLSVKNPYKQT